MGALPGEVGDEEPCEVKLGPEQNCGFERIPGALWGIFPSAERSDAVVIPDLVSVSQPLASPIPRGMQRKCEVWGRRSADLASWFNMAWKTE